MLFFVRKPSFRICSKGSQEQRQHSLFLHDRGVRYSIVPSQNIVRKYRGVGWVGQQIQTFVLCAVRVDASAWRRVSTRAWGGGGERNERPETSVFVRKLSFRTCSKGSQRAATTLFLHDRTAGNEEKKGGKGATENVLNRAGAPVPKMIKNAGGKRGG